VGDLTAPVEAAVRGNPRLRHVQSVLVSVGGELRAERYFRSRRPEDLSNVHSITKSILSTLVGIALADGSLDLDTRAAEVLTAPPPDPRKSEITARHLLTMTSGLDAEGRWDIDEIADRGESWAEGPLAAPRVAEPGTAFAYNNGAAHVLSVLLARRARRPLLELAEERLFGPLGIADYRWPTDPDGNPLGYGHLELRPRDLLKLGQLYLDGGRDVLPADYVAAATTAATAGGPPEATAYGYLWWVTDNGFFGGGFAGQYLYVVPALGLVAVTTGDAAVWIPSSASPRRLLADVVVPAIASA
jgi:CubicO group peptidase (beta-lactamase class C family)